MSETTVFGIIILVLGGAALVLTLRWMDRVEARLLDLEEEQAFSSKDSQ